MQKNITVSVPGSLWHANNEAEQLQFYHEIMETYLFYMTKYDINTIFLDFDRMVNSRSYLYDKLGFILKEKSINFDTFSLVYDEVTKLSIEKTS